MIEREREKKESTHAHIYKKKRKRANQIRQIDNKNNIDDKQPEERS